MIHLTAGRSVAYHRRGQNFVWGWHWHFSRKKGDDLFLVVALKRQSKSTKYTSKSPAPSKNVLKLTLALPGDLTYQIVPVNYA